MNEINLAPDFIDRTIDSFHRVFSIFDVEHLPFIALAVLPALIWLFVFYRFHRKNKLLMAAMFLVGTLAVIPIFVFQHEIIRIEGILKNLSSGIFLTILLTGIWVGFYEEVSKNWVVRHFGKNFFKSIDDAILFSIVVALGFAFIENILYFHSIWNNAEIDESMRYFYVLFRSIGSMFLHIFASGIFGYYYGVAHFAKPVLRKKLASGKKFLFTRAIHRIIHLKSETIFRDEKIFEGLMIAAGLHAAFDVLMGMSQHFTDAGSEDESKIFLILAVPFLVGGYFWLTALLRKKEDHEILGELDGPDILDECNSKIVAPQNAANTKI